MSEVKQLEEMQRFSENRARKDRMLTRKRILALEDEVSTSKQVVSALILEVERLHVRVQGIEHGMPHENHPCPIGPSETSVVVKKVLTDDLEWTQI